MFQRSLRLSLIRKSSNNVKRPTIAIREEQKGKWERRAPLTPDHVKQLTQHAKVLVQPSKKRIFTDIEYKEAGAVLQNDISEADFILGIKEVPIDKLVPKKHYLFFSHTHKAQKHNMGMLKTVLDRKITLSDYELLVNEKNERLVAFGRFAGVAGMIEILNGMGLKLLSQGLNTPFVNIGRAFSYYSTEDAKNAVKLIGDRIKHYGLSKDISPMVFMFTGRGNVSIGAQEVFKMLPHEFLSVDQMKSKWKDLSPNKIYGVIADPQDYLRRTDGNNDFDLKHYFEKGSHAYESVFHEKLLPWVSCLVNGAYWDERYPRLLTSEQYSKIAKDTRLIAIADISCDINGPLEFMDRATTIDTPYFTYDPVSYKYGNSADNDGVLIMSIDNLPAELPADATLHFSEKLFPLILDYVKNGNNITIEKATIALNGNLAPKHNDLARHLVHASSSRKKVLLLGSGRVAAPLVDYFVKKGNVDVTIAGNLEEEVKKLSQGKTKTAKLEVENANTLGELVGSHDLSVSFIPAFLHHLVAEQCIKHKKHLVTASYVSPKMSEFHKSAKEAKVTFLNEIGLDPGIDHMLAMKFFDQVKDKGGKIKSFISWCGGLPAPEFSNNPLGYKFSWSPRGVLTAAMNDAKFKMNGKLETIAKGGILDAAQTVNLFKGFNFEGLANRDSLKYIDIYKLDEKELETMFRGTLRYKGFAEVMVALRDLGLLNDSKDHFKSVKAQYWDDLINNLTGPKSPSKIMSKLSNVKIESEDKIKQALKWFGLFSHIPVKTPRGSETLLDALCMQLESKLSYLPHERDMVCLHHTFGVEYKGQRETYTSSLVCYGNEKYSAMAKTVALPAAVAADLILEGKISETGVLVPTSKAIYEPVLKALTKEGLQFIEEKQTL